jgi:hypothetical protein
MRASANSLHRKGGKKFKSKVAAQDKTSSEAIRAGEKLMKETKKVGLFKLHF